MSDGRPTISTHVLDTGTGAPVSGISVRLGRIIDDGAEVEAGSGTTDSDGRIRDLLGTRLMAGDYRLHFDLAELDGFFRSVALDVHIADAERSCHVPLLLAPYGLTTYRGS